MKTIDYINTLIKEKESLKEECKTYVETIRRMKHEITNLKRKNAKIEVIGNETFVDNMKNEIDSLKSELNTVKGKYAELQCEYDQILAANKTSNVKTQKGKSELSKLRSDYNALKSKYDEVVKENEELKSIFDDIDKICESDEQ